MKPRSFRFPVRVLLLVAVAAALLTLVGSPVSTQTPYASALSNLAASPVFAKGCPDKRCNRNVQCVSGLGYSCNKIGGSGCEATPCN